MHYKYITKTKLKVELKISSKQHALKNTGLNAVVHAVASQPLGPVPTGGWVLIQTPSHFPTTLPTLSPTHFLPLFTVLSKKAKSPEKYTSRKCFRRTTQVVVQLDLKDKLNNSSI